MERGGGEREREREIERGERGVLLNLSRVLVRQMLAFLHTHIGQIGFANNVIIVFSYAFCHILTRL